MVQCAPCAVDVPLLYHPGQQVCDTCYALHTGGYSAAARREMNQERERLVGHPSDYGGRTLEDEEIQRTADGEPLVDRGTAGSAGDDDDPESAAQE